MPMFFGAGFHAANLWETCILNIAQYNQVGLFFCWGCGIVGRIWGWSLAG
jgi:hypothetical protein